MDDAGFAQSRGEDDLFDDELIPIEPSEVQAVTTQLQETSIAQEEPQPPKSIPKGPSVRGGPNKFRNGPGKKAREAAPAPQQNAQPVSEATPDVKETPADAPAPTEDGVDEAKTEPQAARPQAVRGDRTATGGVKKPKLTEEQLTAKMAEAKTRAASLAQAHARAQADAASFNERERVAQEKRKVMAAKDLANRKVMDNEREANRRRKMQAQGGREWDMEKNEEDFSNRGRGRGGGYMRGAHGGVRRTEEQPPPPPSGDDYPDEPPPHFSSERGRGGRGGGRGRGGRGAPRGGGGPKASGLSASKFAPTPDEFPALPPGQKPSSTPSEPKPSTTANAAERPSAQNTRKVSEGDLLNTSNGGGNWADQVESASDANASKS